MHDEQRFSPLHAVVDCAIPRAASDAIDLDLLHARARQAGIEGASIKLSTYLTLSGSVRTRITTDLRLAALLVDRLHEVAAQEPRVCAPTDRAIAYADAIAVLLDAIDNGLGPNLAPITA